MAGGDGGSDRTLIKIAIFGITMSIMATCMVTWFAAGTSDYDYDTIQAYRNDLTTFSGNSLVNDTPWVLTGAYTPFNPSVVSDSDIPNHIDPDGWLYGESLAYSEIGKAADIRLDKDYKSNQLLSVGDPYDYEYRNGKTWWNGGNDFGITVIDPKVVQFFSWRFGQGVNPDEGYVMETGSANNWVYSGIRYTFDPTLPFSNGSSSKDGTLSLVWYDTGSDTGLSGGLEIYGGRGGSSQVLLAHYSASDIIAAYQSNGGYAQVYDFDFDGTHLNLSIRFDPTVFKTYSSLRDAWDDGAWSMAISSASAGNFFDVENSNTFSVTAGTMFDTFIEIYTFEYPKFDEPWVDVILWLLVGLPMSLAMLCLTMRVVGGVFKIF